MGILDAPAKAVLPTDVGFDIVLLWGQSNMRGQNTGYDTVNIDTSDPRIRVVPTTGSLSGQRVLAIEPLAHQDSASGVGPGLPFARAYVSSILPNRQVLLVPSAYGGTAFETAPGSGQNPLYWKITTPDDGTNLYKNAIREAFAAKALAGRNSRFVAILWHQGESDVINGTAPSIYQTDLEALIDQARTDLGVANLPFVIGEMLPENAESLAGYTGINAIHAATPGRKTRCAYAYSPYGMNTSGDGLHFNAIGQRILGRNMFDAYLVAIGAQTGTAPGQVTGLAAAPTASQLTLTWTAQSTATSYWVEYKATSSSTWLPGPGTPGSTAVLTGLSSSTSYDMRVTARNFAGSGTTSAVLTFSTTGPNQAATLSVTSGLVGWYKADTGVTKSGANVTAVTDQSGQANNLAQATTGNQPTWSATALNGAPGFVFPAAKNLTSSTSAGLTGQPTTTFVAMQQNASPTGTATLALVGSESGGRQFRTETSGIQYLVNSGIGVVATSVGAVSTGTPHVVGVRASATKIDFYRDGPTNGSTTTTAPTFVNGQIEVGSKSTADAFLGTIGEVLIYNRALTDAEVTTVQQYLGSRFGIVIS